MLSNSYAGGVTYAPNTYAPGNSYMSNGQVNGQVAPSLALSPNASTQGTSDYASYAPSSPNASIQGEVNYAPELSNASTHGEVNSTYASYANP